MKKLIAMLLALVMVMSFAACGSKDDNSGDNGTVEAQHVTKNDYVNVEGIYVDKSYADNDNAAIKMVYVFLTLTAKDKNLSADSKYTEMTIAGTNTYKSDFYKDSCDFAPSYYYSSYIEEVYVGTDLKVVLTFEVPEGDLTGSKEITFSDSAMPFDDIKMSTDDIVFCDSKEAVCEKGDPEGYAEESKKHAPADTATVNKVKNLINGYYWTFYVSTGQTVQTHEIEFYSPNKFEVRTNFGSNGGTYEVKNGYIYVTYSTNNRTYMIPYEFKDGDVELDCGSAFSIYE